MSVDLTTSYLGMTLKSPLSASAGPLTADVDSLQALEQAGAAAAVLPSLFEEQIVHEASEISRLYEFQTESYAESVSYFPEMNEYRTVPEDYLRLVAEAKKHVSIPIIGSLNGATEGGWTKYAKEIEDAGADALELNIYVVTTDPLLTSADVERRHIDLVASVCDSVSIPVAVKIGPNFSSIPNFAAQMVRAGADGLVLFNRFLEPDIDLEAMEVVPHLVLSSPSEVRLPLRWTAILREYISGSLAATSGVHCGADAIKLILAGADTVMMTSSLLKKGPSILTHILHEIETWMSEHEYESVAQMQGSMSRANCPEPGALERGNYMKALASYTPQYE